MMKFSRLLVMGVAGLVVLVGCATSPPAPLLNTGEGSEAARLLGLGFSGLRIGTRKE
jgi:hypothetical protein